MPLEHKNAIGLLSDREHTQSALSLLKDSGFPMEKVTVVAKHPSAEDLQVRVESEFTRQRTIERIERGALDAGTLGAIAGLLIGGLTTLAIPGIGAVAVAGAEAAFIGMLTGGFYGSVSGAILGAAIGNNVSDEQAKHYVDSLAQGHYLVIVEGSDEEIAQAYQYLKTQGIQDWGIYETL